MASEQPEDPKITELLARLGNQTAEYPPELLANRRASLEQSLSALGVGIAAGGVAKAGLLKGALTAEAIIRALVVIALVAETIGGILLYRQHQLRTPITPTSTATLVTPSRTFTLTLTPTSTLTSTPTTTPTNWITATGTRAGAGPGSAPPAATSTPQQHPTDQGNHYGQTPTPPAKRTPGR